MAFSFLTLYILRREDGYRMAPFAVLVFLRWIMIIRLVHLERSLTLAAQDDVLHPFSYADEAVAPRIELAPLRLQRHAIGKDDLYVRIGDEKRPRNPVPRLTIDDDLVRA